MKPSELKVGQRVRITREGEVTTVTSYAAVIGSQWVYDSEGWNIEVLPDPIPSWVTDEALRPRAVVDCDGNVWARLPSGEWFHWGSISTLPDLWKRYGPLTRLVPEGGAL